MDLKSAPQDRLPMISFRYLHRDGDVGVSTRDAFLRQCREAGDELRRVPRVASGVNGARLAFWTLAYHVGMAVHPIISPQVSTVDVVVAGLPVRVHFRRNQSDLYILREVFLRRIYEYPFEKELGRPVRTVVDLGANIGLSALYFSARFREATVLCVEPVAQNVHMLRRNAAANGHPWLVERAAVAAGSGETELFPNEWWSSSSIVPHVAQSRESKPDARLEPMLKLPREIVPTIAPADLFDRHGFDRVDVCKMDIEGAEADIMAGDTAWLDRVGAVIIEIHDKYVDRAAITAAFAGRGFHPVSGFPGPCDVFLRRDRP